MEGVKASTAAIFDECQAVLDSAELTIKAAVQQCLKDCQSDPMLCEQCIRGKVAAMLDKVGPVGSKCEVKVRQRITDHIADAYFHTQQLLGPVPTIEQVVERINNPYPTHPNFGTCPVVMSDGSVTDFLPLIGPSGQEACPLPRPMGAPPPRPAPLPPPPPPPTVIVNVPCPATCAAEAAGTAAPTTKPPAEGDACTYTDDDGFTFPGHIKDGKCEPDPDTTKPAEGDACTFTDDDGLTYPGHIKDGKCEPDPEQKPESCSVDGQQGKLKDGKCDTTPAPCEGMKDPPTWSDIYSAQSWCGAEALCGSGKTGTVTELLGLLDSGGKPTVPSWLKKASIDGKNLITSTIIDIIRMLSGVVDYALDQIPLPATCKRSDFVAITFMRLITGAAQRWLGVDFGPLNDSLSQWMNANCPQKVGTAADGLSLYLADLIDLPQLEGIFCANGLGGKWAEVSAMAGRTKLTVNEVITADWRKLLQPGVADEMLRWLGYTELQERELVQKVAHPLPGISDLVRFMVRDVDDAQVVQDFDLDNEFEKKFAGRTQEWAYGQGVEDDMMRRYWRSHWQIPSNAALYEMLHRLRPDSPDPDARANAITAAQVENAIKVNDMSPAFVKKLMAISYRPMNFRELRLAFKSGSMGHEDIVSGLRDGGLSKENAERVYTSWERDWKRMFQAEVSGLSVKQVADMYSEEGVTREEALEYFQDAGLTGDQSEKAIESIDLDKQARLRMRLVKMLKRRYLVGDFLPDQAVHVLLNVGTSQDQANRLVREWEAEVTIRGKQIGAAMFCKWLSRGLITPQEYVIRLVRVGYSPVDATRIVMSCEADIAEKAARQLQAAANKQKAAGKQGKPPAPGP